MILWKLIKQDFRNLITTPVVVTVCTIYPWLLIGLFGFIFSSQIKAIESQIITGAICGCCMPDEDIKEVIAILQDRPTPTMLYKAEKKKYGFGLDIVPIKQYGNI